MSQIKHLPDWLARMQKENYFNFIREGFYKRMGGFNEVVLKNGKRIDSYIPGIEIVSRKFTQLGKTSIRNAKSHIDEFITKYKPGTELKNTARNADAINQGGKGLRGKKILEVPPQKVPVPDEVLKHATRNDVFIRDTTGKILNP